MPDTDALADLRDHYTRAARTAVKTLGEVAWQIEHDIAAGRELSPRPVVKAAVDLTTARFALQVIDETLRAADLDGNGQ
jgi:hypothetical protein